MDTSIHIMMRKSKYQKYRYMPKYFDNYPYLGPPQVIAKMAKGFPTLAWEEAGLTTQTVKNRIYVKPSA
jgi:hypothetical protein